MSRQQDPHASAPASAWWRFPLVWLVISGPLAVIVAGFITAWIAWQNVDPVLLESRVPAATEQEASQAPALKARNHAATPRKP